jgi:hypothetical protein
MMPVRGTFTKIVRAPLFFSPPIVNLLFPLVRHCNDQISNLTYARAISEVMKRSLIGKHAFLLGSFSHG